MECWAWERKLFRSTGLHPTCMNHTLWREQVCSRSNKGGCYLFTSSFYEIQTCSLHHTVHQKPPPCCWFRELQSLCVNCGSSAHPVEVRVLLVWLFLWCASSSASLMSVGARHGVNYWVSITITLIFLFFFIILLLLWSLVVIYYITITITWASITITITVYAIIEIGTGYHFIFCWKVVQRNG